MPGGPTCGTKLKRLSSDSRAIEGRQEIIHHGKSRYRIGVGNGNTLAPLVSNDCKRSRHLVRGPWNHAPL